MNMENKNIYSKTKMHTVQIGSSLEKYSITSSQNRLEQWRQFWKEKIYKYHVVTWQRKMHPYSCLGDHNNEKKV